MEIQQITSNNFNSKVKKTNNTNFKGNADRNNTTSQNLNNLPQHALGISQVHFGNNKKTNDIDNFVKDFLNETDRTKATKMLLKQYPELSWLTGDVNASPDGKADDSCGSISKALYGVQHVEFDRSLVGIECLKDVINGDYEAFTDCQKDNVKLTKENFEDLRKFTLSVLKTPKDIDSMIAYTVINDLGKIKSFVKSTEEKTGIVAKDHDDALLNALKYIPETIPSFDRLDEDYKEKIVNALNADFNLGQFVQAENLEGNLKGLKNVSNDARDLYLVHMFYDVAGAAGHFKSNGSLVMTDPTYKGYKFGIEATRNMEEKTEKEAYDDFLSYKADDLELPFENKRDRAMLKLAVMSRANNNKDAQDTIQAFNNLSENEQQAIIKGINGNGIDDCGVLLYYSPAFIQNTVNSNKTASKVENLEKAYKTLAKLYEHFYDENYFGVKTISIIDIANIIKENPEITAQEMADSVIQNN